VNLSDRQAFAALLKSAPNAERLGRRVTEQEATAWVQSMTAAERALFFRVMPKPPQVQGDQ
jgi:hypothetical protein